MSKCCKEECDTAFCPHCGKATDVDPIKGLVRHINASIKSQLGCIKTYESQSPGDPSLQRRKKALHKWESWRDGVQELIEFKESRAVKIKVVSADRPE